MSNKRVQDQQLDAAIKRLLSAAATADTDVDTIAERPHLYSAIRQRIGSADQPARRRRPINFAYASLVLTALVAAVGLYGPGRGGNAPVPPSAPVRAAVTRDIETGKTVPDLSPVPVKATAGDLAVKRPAAVRRKAKKARHRTGKKLTTAERPPLPETFFALDYGGGAVENLSGGRVVRVDVPRSSLFAMGVDLPLENESASVKADVMLGPDGVARAIRLVE